MLQLVDLADDGRLGVVLDEADLTDGLVRSGRLLGEARMGQQQRGRRQKIKAVMLDDAVHG